MHLNAAIVHRAKEEVCEGIAALRAAEEEAPHDAIGLVIVNRIVTQLTAGLNTVTTDKFGHHVAELKSRRGFVEHPAVGNAGESCNVHSGRAALTSTGCIGDAR